MSTRLDSHYPDLCRSRAGIFASMAEFGYTYRMAVCCKLLLYTHRHKTPPFTEPKISVFPQLLVAYLDTEGVNAPNALGTSQLLSLHVPTHWCMHPSPESLPADVQVSLYPVAPRTGLHLAWSVLVVSFCSKMLFTGRSFTRRTRNKPLRELTCQWSTLLFALPALLFLQPACHWERELKGLLPSLTG